MYLLDPKMEGDDASPVSTILGDEEMSDDQGKSLEQSKSKRSPIKSQESSNRKQQQERAVIKDDEPESKSKDTRPKKNITNIIVKK